MKWTSWAFLAFMGALAFLVLIIADYERDAGVDRLSKIKLSPQSTLDAVLLVSEDLDELLELSDRLVVMFHGQLVYEARASEADLTEIGRHMAGH